jgi:hypothetical protein
MTVRTVDVRGPDARGEGARVLQASALVAMGALLLIARAGAPGKASAALAPYQLRIAELSPPEQRLARELREGLTEAEAVRDRTGAWPSVEALAADGVPPFAPDPLAPGMRWRLLRDGATVNYLGTGAGSASYLLAIQEPLPGAGDPPDTPSDEVHHRLRDGTILHVFSCIREGPPPSEQVTAEPWLAGWKQLVVDAPKEQP